MNKIGIAKGATNAKAQKEVRKEKDLRVSQEPKHKPTTKTEIPRDMAFGIMNRPSTPIDQVISNTYGQYAEHEADERYKESLQKPAQKAKPKGVRPTKASEKLLEHQKTKNVDIKNEKVENFKIKRFTKVESRVKAQLKNAKPGAHAHHEAVDEEHKE